MLSQINLHASHASTSAQVCLIGETGPLTGAGGFGDGDGFGAGAGAGSGAGDFDFVLGFGFGQWDAVNFFSKPKRKLFPDCALRGR